MSSMQADCLLIGSLAVRRAVIGGDHGDGSSRETGFDSLVKAEAGSPEHVTVHKEQGMMKKDNLIVTT